MKKEVTFEEKLDTLEKIVKDLENGDTPLDKAIEKFNQAMELANECNQTLEKANEAVAKVLNKNGEFEEFKIKE